MCNMINISNSKYKITIKIRCIRGTQFTRKKMIQLFETILIQFKQTRVAKLLPDQGHNFSINILFYEKGDV